MECTHIQIIHVALPANPTYIKHLLVYHAYRKSIQPGIHTIMLYICKIPVFHYDHSIDGLGLCSLMTPRFSKDIQCHV